MIEKAVPKIIKTDRTIEALAVQGLIFEFLDGFEKCCFLMNFWSGKNRPTFSSFRSDGRRGARDVVLINVGGNGGVP